MELDKLVVITVLLLSHVYCQDVDGWREEVEKVRVSLSLAAFQQFNVLLMLIINYLGYFQNSKKYFRIEN